MRKLSALTVAAVGILTQATSAFAAGTTPAKVATTSSSTPSSLPSTGTFEPTMLVFFGAVLMLFVGAYYLNRAFSK